MLDVRMQFLCRRYMTLFLGGRKIAYFIPAVYASESDAQIGFQF